ncbi:MAG TPA: hypothetical protein VIL95_04630 [Bacillota bacterium]
MLALSGCFGPTPNPEGDTAEPLAPPELTATPNVRSFRSGDEAVLPWFEDHAYYVLAHFDQRLDPASLEGRVDVRPASALREIRWDDYTRDDGQAATVAAVQLHPQPPGTRVEVTLRAGLRSASGRVLQDDQRLSVRWEEPTRVALTLTGTSYFPGPQPQAFPASARQDAPLPVLKPGPAVLEASFTRPPDRRTVEAALRAAAESRFELGQLTWQDDGRGFRVDLTLKPLAWQPAAVTFAGAAAPWTFLPEPVVDELGMPVAPEGAALAWFVADTARVVAGWDPVAAPVAGTVARLPGIQAAGAGAVFEQRLLTWHTIHEEAECGAVASTLWDLPSGTGVPLGSTVDGCHPWAAWSPDGKAVYLLGHDELSRFTLPVDGALPDAASMAAPKTIYRSPAGRFLNGVALAPDGRIALFEAEPDQGANAGRGTIDLLILDSGGRQVARADAVSHLVSSENIWSPIPAAWAPDGSRLAFVSFKASDQRNEAGYPQSIDRRLSLWDAQAGTSTATDVEALDGLLWRPGTAEVLFRTEAGLGLYDTGAGNLTSLTQQPMTPLAWSPDGRHLLLLHFGPEGLSYGLLDVAAARYRSVSGWRPLGWGPDGLPYWLEAPEARSGAGSAGP